MVETAHRPIADATLEHRGKVLLELRTATAAWRIAERAYKIACQYADEYPSIMTAAAEAAMHRRENEAWDMMAEIAVSAQICLWPGCELATPRTTLCRDHADIAGRREDLV